MRKKIVAGNWKMNTTILEGINLVSNIISLLKQNKNNDVLVAIAPPFSHLSDISRIISDDICLVAQNCSYESDGAYTGEISAEMLASIPCNAVIIGHSERRKYFKENNDVLARKVNQCLKKDLMPIFCCGEEISDRESERHFDIIRNQLSEGLFHLSDKEILKVVIAYEPVWAIGTGITASSSQAQEMHNYIRGLLKQQYDNSTADYNSILYGGSCKADNAQDLFNNPDVDGGLIGGASLKAEEFIKIINSF